MAFRACAQRQVDRVRAELLAHLREERIEPPTRDRLRRIIGSALRQAEQTQTARIASRAPPDAIPRLLALIAKSADPGDAAEGQEENDGRCSGPRRPPGRTCSR